MGNKRAAGRSEILSPDEVHLSPGRRIRRDRRHEIQVFNDVVLSHGVVAAIGFAGSIYALPVRIAPEAPSVEEVAVVAEVATYTAEFKRELADSDALRYY